MDKKIAHLPGMTAWTLNILKKHGIETTDALLKTPAEEVLKMKRLGIGRIKSIYDGLMAVGIEPHFTLEQAFEMEKKKDALKSRKVYRRTHKKNLRRSPELVEGAKTGNNNSVVPSQLRVDVEDLAETVRHMKSQINAIFSRLEVLDAAYQTTPRRKSGILKFFKR